MHRAASSYMPCKLRFAPFASSLTSHMPRSAPGSMLLHFSSLELAACQSVVLTAIDCHRRSGQQSMVLGVHRGSEDLDVAVTPALSADGGRIGVHLASNLKLTHKRSSGPVQAISAASIQLARCFGVVLGGVLL